MRVALLLLCLSAAPAYAQEAAQWVVEPGSPRRAATIEYEQSETLSYGFSCWRKHWVFFFNYQAPQGGICPNHDACETNVADVQMTFKTPGRDDFSDRFTLFENYYFQAEDLGLFDIEAMVKAGGFRLALDDKLKTVWSRDDIEFSLKGFEEAAEANKKTLVCETRVPLPSPLARPALAALQDKIVAEKTVKPSRKSRKAELKEKHSRLKALKKSKPPKAKALKTKPAKTKPLKKKRR